MIIYVKKKLSEYDKKFTERKSTASKFQEAITYYLSYIVLQFI